MILLGLVQGATEFLPVSSSGHLVLAQWLLGVRRPGLSLEIALHAGTLVAVAVTMAGRIRRTWRGLLLPAVVASVPAAGAGLLLRPLLERAFEQPAALGAGWLVTGAGLLWAGRLRGGGVTGVHGGRAGGAPADGGADATADAGAGRGNHDGRSARPLPPGGAPARPGGPKVSKLSPFLAWSRRARGSGGRTAPPQRAVSARTGGGTATSLGLRDALVIGLFQAVALVPGVSRSGAALVGGLAVGLEPGEAAAFAFLLALPSVGGATLLELPAWRGEGSLWLGAGVAALAGAAAIRLFLRGGVPQRLSRFGAYCAALGLGTLAAAALAALGLP